MSLGLGPFSMAGICIVSREELIFIRKFTTGSGLADTN